MSDQEQGKVTVKVEAAGMKCPCGNVADFEESVGNIYCISCGSWIMSGSVYRERFGARLSHPVDSASKLPEDAAKAGEPVKMSRPNLYVGGVQISKAEKANPVGEVGLPPLSKQARSDDNQAMNEREDQLIAAMKENADLRELLRSIGEDIKRNGTSPYFKRNIVNQIEAKIGRTR